MTAHRRQGPQQSGVVKGPRMNHGLPPNSRAARRVAAQRQEMRSFLLSRARQLFISHCEADIAWCRPFADALCQAGADVWFDEAHRGSRRLIDGIEAELYRWGHVFVRSPAATTCPRVQREVAAAASVWKQRPGMHFVLPVVAERADSEPRQLQPYAHVAGPGSAGLAPTTAATRIGYILALDDPLGRPLQETPAAAPQEITAEDAYLRGRVLYGPGTREDALRAWDVAIQLNPTEARYWRERGEALHRLKRFEDALAALDRALELNPRSSGAWRIRASVLAYQGRFEAALDAAEHAIAIDGHPNAWSTKIRALRRLGRETEAQAATSRLRQALDERWRPARVTAELARMRRCVVG